LLEVWVDFLVVYTLFIEIVSIKTLYLWLIFFFWNFKYMGASNL